MGEYKIENSWIIRNDCVKIPFFPKSFYLFVITIYCECLELLEDSYPYNPCSRSFRVFLVYPSFHCTFTFGSFLH